MSESNIINWQSFELPDSFKQGNILHSFIKPIFALEEDPSKGRLSELINGRNPGLSGKILETLAKTTKDRESGQLFNYTNYPYLLTGKKIWEKHMDRFPSEEQRLATIVHNLCTKDYNIKIIDADENPIFDLSKCLKEINKANYGLTYQLATLSILATTWQQWDNLRNDKSDKKHEALLSQLAKMIFPVPTSVIDKRNSMISSETNDNVVDLYSNAVALFEKGDYKKSAELFTEIVTEHLTAPYEILANSYTSLIKCYGISSIDIPTIGTKDELKRWALHYGSNDIKPRSHEIRQRPQRSDTTDNGFYLFNHLDNS